MRFLGIIYSNCIAETVNYFRKNNSNVYVMLLDATKAFDKVNYVFTS